MRGSTDKPRWFGAQVGGLVLAVAIIALGGWYFMRRAVAKPVPLGAYGQELNALAAARQPKGPNGWPAVRDAIAQYRAFEDATRRAFPPPTRERPQRPAFDLLVRESTMALEDWPIERDGLATLAEPGSVFEQLDRAVAFKSFVREIPPDVTSLIDFVDFEHIAGARQLRHAIAVAMRVAAESGDDEARVQNFERQLVLVRATQSQAVIVAAVAGFASERAALTELRCQILETPLTADAARALADAFNRHLALRAETSYALEGERVYLRASIDAMFEDTLFGGERLKPALGQTLNVGAAKHAGRRETREAVETALDGLMQNLAIPVHRRAAEGFDAAVYLAHLGPRYELVHDVVLAVDKYVLMADMIRAERALMRTRLAIEAYRAVHGAPPAVLGDLVPESIDAVPVDPISGGAFVYRPTPFECTPGCAYTLYSAGADGVDDIGRALEEDAPTAEAIREMGTLPWRAGRDFLPEMVR